MVLHVQNQNNVKIYSVTAAGRSALPDWIARKNHKSLKKDTEYRRRIELIQDFSFPEASLKIKCTRDGKHIMATGVYKPQIRVYELAEVSMKFERHTDCDNVAFEILSNDWTKSIHLQSDRSVEFHTSGAVHYRTRVPKCGRDLAYHYPSCDLLVGGASSDVWRLNLELGRFMPSLKTSLKAVNVTKINPVNQLWTFGGEDGLVEFWDPRHRSNLTTLNVPKALLESNTTSTMDWDSVPEVTAIEYGWDGLSVAIGTSSGHVLLYDLRNPTPMVIKDHQYGCPIKGIQFHGDKVVSADTKICKVWDRNDGAAFTSIEPPADINDLMVYPQSGLIVMACEEPQMQAYYVPSLGPAPRWCSFLDNLTEELEENPETAIYDDYKFITRKELVTLGLDHLIGTSLLRAYMHGFFIDYRLYEKAKLIANPFQYEDFRQREIAKKIEEQSGSRISSKLRKIKVNKTHPRLVETVGEDERFKSLFEDKDYQIDEDTHEYKLKYPIQARQRLTDGQLKAQGFSKMDSDAETDDDEEDAASVQGLETDFRNEDKAEVKNGSDDEDEDRDEREDRRDAKPVRAETTAISSIRPKPSKPQFKKKGPAFYEMNSANSRGSSKSFQERMADNSDESGANRRHRGGNMSMTFKPKSGKPLRPKR